MRNVTTVLNVLIGPDCVSVGHSADEIGNLDLGLVAGMNSILGRHFIDMLDEIPEEFIDQPVCLRLFHLGVALRVDVPTEKSA